VAGQDRRFFGRSSTALSHRQILYQSWLTFGFMKSATSIWHAWLNLFPRTHRNQISRLISYGARNIFWHEANRARRGTRRISRVLSSGENSGLPTFRSMRGEETYAWPEMTNLPIPHRSGVLRVIGAYLGLFLACRDVCCRRFTPLPALEWLVDLFQASSRYFDAD